MIYKFRAFFNKTTNKLDIHTLDVLKKSASSTLIKILGMLVSLIISIFLGRRLGAYGLGIINLATTIVNILLVFTIFGFQNVIIKKLSIAKEVKDWKQIRSVLFTSRVFNGALAVFISILFITLTPYLCDYIFEDSNLKIPLVIAVAMIVPQTFSRIYGSALNGFSKIWQSSLVNEVLSIWTVGIGILFYLFFEIKITVVTVAILYAIGRLVVTVFVGAYWNRIFKNRGDKEFVIRPMLKMALPLVLVTGVAIVTSSSDKLMLGWLSSSSEVGIYSVASRLSLLISFFLIVSNAAISPKLASLYANKRTGEMKILVKRVTGVLILIGLFFLIFFFVFGNTILEVWGKEFTEAYWILVVLSIGQFINVASGCVGLILVMCDLEKIHGYISFFGMFLNLGLNYFLILDYGAMGAAIATSIIVILENTTKYIIVKIKIF